MALKWKIELMSTHERDRPLEFASTTRLRPRGTMPAGSWRTAGPGGRADPAVAGSDGVTSVEDYARHIAEEIGRTWRRMGLIWPGTDFAGLVPLILDRDATFEIRSDGTLTPRPPGEFDQRPLLTGRFLNFGFALHRGAHAPWLEVPASVLGRGRFSGEYRAFPRATAGFAVLTH